jgi:hypothetical protein
MQRTDWLWQTSKTAIAGLNRQLQFGINRARLGGFPLFHSESQHLTTSLLPPFSRSAATAFHAPRWSDKVPESTFNIVKETLSNDFLVGADNDTHKITWIGMRTLTALLM